MERLVKDEAAVDENYTKTSALVDILLEPKRAILEMRGRSVWSSLPLVIMLGLYFGIIFWYFSTIDPVWYQNYMLSLQVGLTNEQAALTRQYLQPNLLLGSTIVFGSMWMIIVMALWALYYYLIDRVLGYTRNFMEWFSFTVWTSFPSALSTISMYAAYWLDGSYQIDLNMLLPLSLNNLVFGLSPTNSWFALINSVQVTTLWTLLLAGYGISIWLEKSFKLGMVLATVPYLIFYGVWSLFI